MKFSGFMNVYQLDDMIWASSSGKITKGSNIKE